MRNLSTSKSKKMGRPPVDAQPLTVRVHPPLRKALDAWIASQPEPRPSRPEAMRQLASQALGLPSEKVPSLDEKIAHTKERLASVEVPKEPSPEKGMAMLRKGYGENKLRKLRAQRARKLT